MNAPRILIGGQCSGIGKSTITVGILLALRKLGLDPQPFKAGPDFLDPMHHSLIAGRGCRNLDTWMFPDAVRELFQRSSQGAGISVVEGVMGLYDGLDGRSEEGSSAHLAKKLDCPVIIVADASGSARSVGAVVEGFRRYDPDVNIAGVIVNRCGSKRHYQMVKDSIRDVPVLGGVMKRDGVELKSRHLGLVPAEEQFDIGVYDGILSMIEEDIDMDMLLSIAESAPPMDEEHSMSVFGDEDTKVRLGVAKDRAFNFYYEDNFDILKSHGAEIVPFSPIDDGLPDVDGLYIGGGFPEMFASEVSANDALHVEIREASHSGMPIYAECGGLMFLCDSMKDLDGRRHPMCSIFDADVEMTQRLQALGYVEVRNEATGPLMSNGMIARGHEFHYSFISRLGDEHLAYDMRRGKGIRDGRDGLIKDNTLASYTHMHFASRPDAAKGLISSCLAFKEA